MCRDNSHGGRRCPNDTSLARRLRRRLSEARKSNTTVIPVSPSSNSIDSALPVLTTLEDMKRESEALNSLLHVPELENQEEQDKLDNLLEKRVRNLGFALGLLAEERSKFNFDKYTAERDFVPPSLTEALTAKGAAQSEISRTVEINESFPTFEQWSENKEVAGADLAALEEQWALEADAVDDDNWNAVEHFSAMEDAVELETSKETTRQNALDQKTAEALSTAYRQVIADMRSVGGEVAVIEEASNPNTIRKLGETVGKHYPSAWLEASSSSEGLVVKEQIGVRAGYTPKSLRPGVEGELRDATTVFMLPSDSSATDLSKLRESPGAIESTKSRPFMFGNIMNKAYEGSLRVPFDPNKLAAASDGSPLDKTNFHYGYTLEEDPSRVSSVKSWYRIPENRIVTGPEILVGAADPDSIYYHEFSHRMEDTVPHNLITRQEEAFLRRRTTENNVREELSPIYQMISNDVRLIEAGRRDNFLHHYMGKEYLYCDSREVLAMGAEAIFAGNFGALAGVKNDGYDRADLDYRAFVLGIFAAA